MRKLQNKDVDFFMANLALITYAIRHSSPWIPPSLSLGSHFTRDKDSDKVVESKDLIDTK